MRMVLGKARTALEPAMTAARHVPDQPARAPRALPGREDHPLRAEIANEVHARPYEMVVSPARASFLCLYRPEEFAGEDRDHLSRLCERLGAAPPAPGALHYSADLGRFRVRWESHTEFASYGFLRAGANAGPFADTPLGGVPEEWLGGLPGEVLVALQIAIERGTGDPQVSAQLAPHFGGTTLAGSLIAGGAARVWTDFRVHEDGFSRILIEDLRLGRRQLGRLVQRLMEIEAYRHMALLAFPEARRNGPALTRVERALAALTARICQGADEQRLLGELSDLTAEVEAIATATSYRFSAAEAYSALVARRIDELREQRIEGVQTFGEFMNRRLAPAMRTCASVAERVRALSTRAGRVGELLQARVSLALEQQNRDLLASMNRRARLQLRLQETVEGLSIVVLSYYLVGLAAYVLKGAKAAGLAVEVDLLAAAAVPLVVAGVYLLVRRFRRLAALK